MAAAKIKLSSKGLEEIAKSREVRSAVGDLAEEIGRNVESLGIKVGDKDGGSREYPLPVRVITDDTTSGMNIDRVRAVVILAHASGIAVQAKHGALTKAASQAGVRVKGS